MERSDQHGGIPRRACGQSTRQSVRLPGIQLQCHGLDLLYKVVACSQMLDNVFRPRIDPRVRMKLVSRMTAGLVFVPIPGTFNVTRMALSLCSATECIPALCARPSRTASIRCNT
ncbi:hypothetical protein BO83DRAFT_246880 [Aspergillus eucalypticola CBS 122712]|uniref:Uncharacterized protein n=1 Tax=Aspergillus eucalypticola (strain CBS 122712 / IBT 29274) TaxID=1448314 RepID=A0A317VRA9_ASPEC|nr:uncharacterized protein BO83DRAFT_246880 [Aspergillus eucalypticola CBS 122712]PWY75821.1 hypothetical protein BO83DRAFT_246880 [Aspergillus eucalypticola CBS 122712]